MGHEQPLPDAELVRHVLAGRREDFGTLVRRYLPALQALAYSKTGNQADAEEVTQEALLKGFKYLDRLKEPARFGAWMAAIVRNVAFTFLRKRPQTAGALHDRAAAVSTVEPDVEGRDHAVIVQYKCLCHDLSLSRGFCAHCTCKRAQRQRYV